MSATVYIVRRFSLSRCGDSPRIGIWAYLLNYLKRFEAECEEIRQVALCCFEACSMPQPLSYLLSKS